MSLESSDKPPINPKIKEIVDSGFRGGRKLYGDSWNQFYVANGCDYSKSTNLLCPLLHYKERMEEARSSKGHIRYPQEEIDYVMELSDPEAVAAYNQIVDEFNADLDRIKAENDFAAAKDFAKRAHELVYKKG